MGLGGEKAPPRHPRRLQGKENLREEPAVRSLPTFPSRRSPDPASARPRPREAVGFGRLGTAGSGKGSSSSPGREVQRTRSPAQRTVLGTRPTPVHSVFTHKLPRPSTRTHSRLRAQFPRSGRRLAGLQICLPGLEREGPRRRL